MKRLRPHLTGVKVIVACVAFVLLAGIGGPHERVYQANARGADPQEWIVQQDGLVEDGWSGGLVFHRCCADSIQTVTSTRTGEDAQLSQLRYGDDMVADGTRAEVHTGQIPESSFHSGDTVYYGFSIYVMGDWETDSSEEIVFQWHTAPDECEDEKFPSAFMSIQPTGVWRLRVNSDEEQCSTGESITKQGFDLAEVQPGQWHDFVFKFDWDYTKNGAIEAWHQTDQQPGWESVLSTTGANTFNDDSGTDGYLKWGIYKPNWNDGPTDVDSRVLIHDNVAFGPRFSAVDPAAKS